MQIDGRTKIIGVMGWPVEHTLSPAMQNAALEEMGLNWVYIPMPVNPDHLGDAVAGMRAINSPGWNLTIPHKLNIIPLLDVVMPEALAVGAVNTVVRRDGRLVGYNTDIAGFRRSAEKEGFRPSGGEPVLVAGSGGVARAIAYALSHAGCDLTVVSRNLQKTAQMCAEIGITANVIEYHDEQVPYIMQRSQLLVNATSLGMGAQADCSLPLPLEMLNKGALVFDTVYSPAETKLMTQARLLGYPTCNGLGMLLMQGAAALELWTQRDVPIESMNNAIQQAFQSR
ncbi:MAG: shikimate dehydrogenase [Armatimonadota bacterium]